MPTNDFMGNGHTRANNSTTHNGETPPNTGTEASSATTAGQHLPENVAPLVVRFGRCGADTWWAMIGSRAQLEAEGVIPKGLVWPQGRRFFYWNSRGLNYQIGRTRPEGLKGPMRLWTSGDLWFFRCDHRRHDSFDACRLEQMRKALADELHRQSPDGRAEHRALRAKLQHADEDAAFQALKAKLIPAKAGKKNGGAA